MLKSILLGVLLLSICSSDFAAEKEAQTVLTASAILNQNPVPIIRRYSREKLNRIFTFDHKPLGERTPVILLPGRAEEYQSSSWWKKMRKMSLKYPGFEDHFKLYIYQYDSKEELDKQADDFIREFKQYFFLLPPARQAILVSYSLGGVITRDALEDREVFDRIQSIIAIGVPFHGTPIFDPDWLTKYIQPQNRSPVRQVFDKMVYRAYLLDKNNLTRGLKWDNYDGSKPQYNQKESVIGDQIVSRLIPYTEREKTLEFKQKTTVYASYMDNQWVQRHRKANGDLDFPQLLEKTTFKVPQEVLGTVLPLYGSSVHGVFKYMNLQLGNLPTYSSEHPQGKNAHLYRLNDGVIPLSSALYLPQRDRPYDEDLDTLLQSADVKQVRIFPNLDHMHLGEYSLRQKVLLTNDLLHPEDGLKTPNNWVFYDLLRSITPSK